MANFDIGEERLQHLETANLQRTSFVHKLMICICHKFVKLKNSTMISLSQVCKADEFNDDLPFPSDEILSQACMKAEEQYDNAEMAQAIM